jgi:hypothetical protein
MRTYREILEKNKKKIKITHGTNKNAICADCGQPTRGYGGRIDKIDYCDDCLDEREILNESLKSPYPYEIITKNAAHFIAEWDIPGTGKTPSLEYRFQAMKTSLEFDTGIGSSWDVEFIADVPARYGTDILGTGNAFRTFATVSAIMKDFLKAINPNVFYFSAEEPSRVRLYDRFAKQIKKITGYKFAKLLGEDDVLYILSKKKLTLNNLPEWYEIVKRS